MRHWLPLLLSAAALRAPRRPTRHRTLTRLAGKKAKKIDREAAWAEKKAKEAAAAARRAGRATDIAPAAIRLGGRSIAEDHNHEQR